MPKLSKNVQKVEKEFKSCSVIFKSMVSLLCWPAKNPTLLLCNVEIVTRRDLSVSTASTAVTSGVTPNKSSQWHQSQ